MECIPTDIITISIHDTDGTTSDTETEDKLKNFATLKGALVTICVGNVVEINDITYSNVAWPANKIAQTALHVYHSKVA